MSGKMISSICVLIIIAWASVVLSSGTGTSFGYEVYSDPGGTTHLKITSKTTINGALLGITFYPPNVKDIKDAQSQLIPLKSGENVTDIKIDSRFKNGTMESAIWGKKLSKNECPANDTICQDLGYKLIDKRAYLWGYL